MEKEVGLWEVVASWRDLGMGNKLGKILLLDRVYTSKNNHSEILDCEKNTQLIRTKMNEQEASIV